MELDHKIFPIANVQDRGIFLDYGFILIVSGTFSSPALVLSVLMVRVSCNSNLPAGSLSTEGATSN